MKAHTVYHNGIFFTCCCNNIAARTHAEGVYPSGFCVVGKLILPFWQCFMSCKGMIKPFVNIFLQTFNSHTYRKGFCFH